MNILAATSLISFLATTLLGAKIYYGAPQARENRLFALLCASSAVAAFGDFMIRSAETREAALLWIKVTDGIWYFVLAFAFHFALTVNRNWMAKDWSLLGPVYGSATVLFVMSSTASGFVFTGPWGYDFAYTNLSIMTRAAIFWGAIIGSTSIYVTWQESRRALGQRKQQLRLIVLGLSVPAFFGGVRGFAVMANLSFPDLSVPSMTILVLIIGSAIWKYELFIVSPESTARNLIDTMTDAMIVFDSHDRVLDINDTGLKKLGYNHQDLENLSQIMPRRYDRECILEELGTGRKVINYESVYRTRAGLEVPVLFSGSPVRDRGGDIVAYLGIVRDISDLKILEHKLQGSLGKL